MGYSAELDERFLGSTPRELLNFVCGQELGHGMTREVFRFKPDETLVIKCELEGEHFQNIAEWFAWQAVEHTELAKWFAPCHAISECGRFLLMKYAEPIAAIKLPAKVPAFFTDLKAKNWGIYKNYPVALDYGKSLLLEQGISKRLRNADWS